MYPEIREKHHDDGIRWNEMDMKSDERQWI
jgi:hypothetical protein